MPNALEVIDSVIAQHAGITENIKTTGEKMNDVDAGFSVQVAAYKTAQSAFPVTNLLDKRDQLLKTVDILAEGLKRHFDYEEKALPLVFGDLLMKEILHTHSGILGQIDEAKTTLLSLGELSRDELLAKRLDLIRIVNELRDNVIEHAQHEERMLTITKKVFEATRPAVGRSRD